MDIEEKITVAYTLIEKMRKQREQRKPHKMKGEFSRKRGERSCKHLHFVTISASASSSWKSHLLVAAVTVY